MKFQEKCYACGIKFKDDDDIVYIDDDKTAHQECAEKAFYNFFVNR